jgi:hypothetical protein
MTTPGRLARLQFAIIAVIVLTRRVESHQVDEYLQATRIDVARQRVTIDVALTPGSAVAPGLRRSIDRDDDGRISPAEIAAYGRRVLGDLSLQIDGEPCPLRLARADAPSWEELQDGTGTMRLQAIATPAPLGRGTHRIAYNNGHGGRDGVYLVNALVPSGPDITIRRQLRDRLQHGIELEIAVESRSDAALAGVTMFGVFSAALAVRWRRSWKSRQVFRSGFQPAS